MKLDIRSKLFLVIFVLSMTISYGAGLYLEIVQEKMMENRIIAEVAREARMIQSYLGNLMELPDQVDLQQWVCQLGKITASRITLIDDVGKVLADSGVPFDQLAKVANHADRPEVIDANRTGFGMMKRYSQTVGESMVYVGIPFFLLDKTTGVVRVAVPLHDVEMALSQTRKVLLSVMVVVCFALLILSGIVSHFGTLTLRILLSEIHSLNQGMGKSKVTIKSQDEIGVLAGTFNLIAEELEEAVLQLAEERNRFKTVLEAMSEGVIAVDHHQSIAMINLAAMHLLGYSTPPLGWKLTNVFSEVVAEQLKCNSHLDHSCAAEFDLFPANSMQAKRVQVTGSLMSFAKGGCVLVMRDITEMRRQEKIHQDFVANVSHELRTPVAVIMANAETLADYTNNKSADELRMLQGIVRHANRLAKIITDLLELARLDAGHYPMQLKMIAIYGIVEHVISILDERYHDKTICIENKIDPQEVVLADQTALEQIIINFLDNSYKYIPNHSGIVLQCQTQENFKRIMIEDHGHGIAEKHFQHLFKRFYRVDTGRSRKLGGTGLGLAIVQHLVEKMGGEVGVESVQPHGVRFWFTLPANGGCNDRGGL